jgi:hypothetical protein
MGQQDAVTVVDVATVALTPVSRAAPEPALPPADWPADAPTPTASAQQATLAHTGADPPPEG